MSSTSNSRILASRGEKAKQNPARQHAVNPEVHDAESAALALAGDDGEVKFGKNSVTTYCPTHGEHPWEGSHPSLMLFDRPEGGVSAHCQTGCERKDIEAELKQLYPNLFNPRSPDLPVPDHAIEPRFSAMAPKETKFVKAWAYEDIEGKLCYYRARFDKLTTNSKGKPDKVFLPFTFYNGYGWGMKAPPMRMLYGLPLLKDRPDARVVLVEGEKTADSGRELLPDHIVMTWDGGAGGPDGVDFTPLAGREVIIWPDADRPKKGKIGAGMRAAQVVAAKLAEIGAKVVTIVPVERLGLPADGWDLADKVEGDGVNIDAALAQAEPYDPSASSSAASAGDGGEDDQGSKRDQIVSRVIAMAHAADDELWKNEDGLAHVTVRVELKGDTHKEHYRVASQAYRDILNRRYYKVTKRALNQEAETAVVNSLRIEAELGETHKTWTRVGEHGGNIYVDTGWQDWAAIEIDAEGFRTISDPPVRFIRSGTRCGLAEPEEGGTLDDFRATFNLSDDDLKRTLAFGISTFLPNGPFAILMIRAPSGTAKSSMASKLVMTIDPSADPVSARFDMPNNAADMFINGLGCRLVLYDNVGRITPEAANRLCRATTGGALTKRKLHSDGDEFMIAIKRPIIITCLERPTPAPDVLNRSIEISPLPLPYMPEEIVWEEFFAVRGKLLGFLLNALSIYLRRKQKVVQAIRAGDLKVSRLADVAAIVEAAAPAIGLAEGEFCQLVESQQKDADMEALEQSPLVSALRRSLIIRGGELHGTAAQIVGQVHADVTQGERAALPQHATAFGKALVALQPDADALRLEIDVERDKGRNTNVYRIVALDREEHHGQMPF